MIRSILIACAVVAFAACGGDDDGDNGTPDGGGGGMDVEVVTCPSSVAEEIGTMMAVAFTNANPTISVGEVIRFTPTGGHDMQSTNSVTWDSGALGATACLKFNKAGSYPYRCSAHAAMTGTVTVQ